MCSVRDDAVCVYVALCLGLWDVSPAGCCVACSGLCVALCSGLCVVCPGLCVMFWIMCCVVLWIVRSVPDYVLFVVLDRAQL